MHGLVKTIFYFRATFFLFLMRIFIWDFSVKAKVNGFSIISSDTQLGNNVNFNGMKIYKGGKVIIGDNFHSGKGCEIITKNHNIHGEYLPYDNSFVKKDVVIGDNVWLGNDVLILPGAEIGEGVVVQARSVVIGKIPPYSIVGGHPAVLIKTRDVEHYELLKSKQKFH